MKVIDSVIIPIGGVDEAMAGSTIDGCVIRLVEKNKHGCNVFEDYMDDKLYEKIEDVFNVFGDIFCRVSYAHNKGFMILVAEKEAETVAELEKTVSAIRLCKTSKFCCWHPLMIKDGKLMPQGGRVYNYNLAHDDIPCLETTDLSQISMLSSKVSSCTNSEVVKRMLEFYNRSFNEDNIYLSFILRVTVLEMFIDNNRGISSNLKRSLAVFLGRDENESEKIYNDIGKIYRIRSEFLHSGIVKNEDTELFDLATEYCRRMILNLVNCNEQIDAIRNKLFRSGFGVNPYGVTM